MIQNNYPNASNYGVNASRGASWAARQAQAQQRESDLLGLDPQDTFTPSQELQLAQSGPTPVIVPLRPFGTGSTPANPGAFTPQIQQDLMRARPLEGGRTGYGR